MSVDALDEAERLLPVFPETAVALLEQVVREESDANRCAQALSMLALHGATARSGEGLRHAQERLEAALTLGPTSELSCGWLAQARGYVAYREARDEQALTHLNEAAERWRSWPRLRARAFDALGMLLGRRGDLDGAIDYFTLALEHKRDDERAQAISHGNLGRLALLAERHHDAERWLRLDLDALLRGGERLATVAHVRNQLALALTGQGRHDEARRELLESLACAPPRSVVRAYALKDLARSELSSGDLPAARAHLAEAQREVSEGAFDEVTPWLALLEAELKAPGATPGRWSLYERAFQGFVERQAPQQACEAAMMWAEALRRAGQPGDAQPVLEAASRLAEAHLFRQENPLARIEASLESLGTEGASAVLRGRIRRMLGGVSEHWLLEQRSGAYHARRLQGERRRVTVWTCDLRGFTEFCARTDDPRRVVRTLNRFFARVGQALLEQQGCIDKYVGDSILAYFQGEGAEERACDATLEAFRRLRELNAERAHLGEPPLVMGVGIASGSVVEGNVGFAGKLEHTIIGTPVNTACRLVARAAGAQTLVDLETTRALGSSHAFSAPFALDLKGLGSVEAAELLGRLSPTRADV